MIHKPGISKAGEPIQLSPIQTAIVLWKGIRQMGWEKEISGVGKLIWRTMELAVGQADG